MALPLLLERSVFVFDSARLVIQAGRKSALRTTHLYLSLPVQLLDSPSARFFFYKANSCPLFPFSPVGSFVLALADDSLVLFASRRAVANGRMLCSSGGRASADRDHGSGARSTGPLHSYCRTHVATECARRR